MYFQIISHPVLEAIGAALLHSLWQGALVAGGLFLALRLIKSTNASARYALSSAALVVLFLLPISTGVQIYLSSQSDPSLFEGSEGITPYQALPLPEAAPLNNEAIAAPSTAQRSAE
nr:hypothetical protein [Rhodothermaceae bacterium]